jgi:hypothetical protein
MQSRISALSLSILGSPTFSALNNISLRAIREETTCIMFSNRSKKGNQEEVDGTQVAFCGPK